MLLKPSGNAFITVAHDYDKYNKPSIGMIQFRIMPPRFNMKHLT